MESVSGIGSFGGLTGIESSNYKKDDLQDSTGVAGLHDNSNIDLMRNSSISGESLDFGA